MIVSKESDKFFVLLWGLDMKRHSALTAALALMLLPLECFAQAGAGREAIKVSGKAENKAIWKFDTHG